MKRPIEVHFKRPGWRVLVLGSLTLFVLILATLAHLVAGQGDNTRSTPPVTSALNIPVFTDEAHQKIKFATCLCRDRQGRVWIGTENQGIWRYDPRAPVDAAYLHFAAADGPGDDTVYALACDGRGRVWAGTLNHGVAVFNGQTWQRYAPPEGPLGSRVFALAVSPVSGGVWMATEAGLARYEQGQWAYYTRANGLPSDQAAALAFAPDGTLYVGTQCDGIAIGSPHDGYRSWRVVPGPAAPVQALRGAGLPSGLINCLLVTHDGTAWAGTTAGLAHSGDGGRTWAFRRGGDWQDKAFGRFTSGYADFPKINGIEVVFLSGRAFAVRANGKAEGRFLATRGFTGGRLLDTGRRIDTSHVSNAAPQAVYQAERYGDCTFTATGLRPRRPCRVRLHFSEIIFHEPSNRLFDVSINGTRVLDHFDIYKAAGAQDRAVVREFPARTDAQGRLQVAFVGTAPGPDEAGLSEDYVTCVADDGAGHLLVGHRQQPPEMLDLKTGARQSLGANVYTRALLPLNAHSAWAATYGDGMAPLSSPGLAAPAPAREAEAFAPLPVAPGLPTRAQMEAMRAEISRVAPDPKETQPKVVALADDWQTQGNWLGRYGRYWACFPALFHPEPVDYLWGAGWEPVNYGLTMGPNHAGNDSLRYWLETRYTAEAHCLELPPTYLHSRVLKGYTTWENNRRDTSVDDHGETYPMSLGGPSIYAAVTVPPGLYTLSLYFFTRQDYMTGRRDYRLSAREHVGASLEDVAAFQAQPELASGRVREDFGGVWKRFLVRGPVPLTVQVDRNNSWNTELDGVMLDLVDETPAPYFQTVDQWNARESQREKQRQSLVAPGALASRRFHPAASEADAANRLFDALAEKRLTNSAWWATEGRRYYAPLLRWYANVARQPAPDPRTRLFARLATCEYQLGQYGPWEDYQKAEGLTTARDIEKSLRWDGVTDSCSGLGYEIVTAHLAEQSGHKESRAPGHP